MLALLLSVLAASAGPCARGGEFEPPLCPTGLTRIVALRSEVRGFAIWPEDALDSPCHGFVLTETDARRFFRGAREADALAVHYTLPESPCVVQGHVRFADGTDGRWQIDRYALGWLDRPGRPRMILYCRRCRRAPWMQ